MNPTPQELFDKHAKKGMIQYDPAGFIKDFPHLHSCILAAIGEALEDKIEPYIFTKSKTNGFSFYKYLHIRGGSGNWKQKGEKHRSGGEYNFIVFYAMPQEMKDNPPEACERLWCRENRIVYGEGNTIREAYLNYKQKASQKEADRQS